MGRAQVWPTQRLFESAVIADPHLLVAQGVARLLSGVITSIRIVGTGDELVASALSSPPELVVSELKLPGMSGIDAMRTVHDAGHRVPFVYLTKCADTAMAVKAVRAGARGYLGKTAAGGELFRALEDVVGGRTYIDSNLAAGMIASALNPAPAITPARRRILELVARGLRTRDIAATMGLSVRTVESHKYIMMQDFKVHSTLELLRRAKADGVIQG